MSLPFNFGNWMFCKNIVTIFMKVIMRNSNCKCWSVEYLCRSKSGSGVIFTWFANMKVPFIIEQPLFTERSYRAVSKSYWALNVDSWTTSLWKCIEGIWSKFGLLSPYSSVFFTFDAQKRVEMVESNSLKKKVISLVKMQNFEKFDKNG